MENKKWLLPTIFIVIIFILIIISFNIPEKKGSKENLSNDVQTILKNAQEESQSVNKEEQKEFTEIDIETYLNDYENEEDSLVLIGRPGCQYCQIAEPILHNIAYEYNITFYYLNIDNLTEEGQSKLQSSDEFFKEGFGTPLLLIIGNNKIKDKVDGLMDRNHYIDFLKENNYIE